ATFGNIWDIEYSITDSNTMYVGTSGKGLYRTTDGAKSFERVINSGAVTDVEVFPNGSVLVAITNSGIFRSANGAAGSFTKITKGTPSGGFNRLELAKCDSFPNVVYANFTLNVDGVNGRNIGIWKSSTGGKTWYQVSEPLRSPSDIFAQPWFSLALGVDPLDSQKIVTGCRDMVFSKNGGKTWSQAKNGHADHMVYTFSHDRPGYFYCGNDGGIYEHNWETINRIVVNKNNDYNVTQYYAGTFTPDSTGNMAGSQDNGTNYSENGMESYKEDALGGDGAFCHIHQENPEAAYMSSQNGHIQKTQNLSMFNMTSSSVMMDMDANADGEIDDGAWFINPFEMNYKNSDMLFFPTRKRLWFSFDGASSWYPITNQIVNLYAVGIPNNQEPYRVYTGGDNLQLYRIDDLYLAEAGNEVSIRKNLPQGLNSGFISNITVHPRRDDIIYISLSNYSNKSRLWRIEDADTDNPKWIDIGSNLPTQLPVNWMVADPYRPDSFFVAGTDFGLYTTANAGKTWIKDERLPNVMVQNLRLRFSDRKLFIFTYGRGVYTANLTPMEDPFISINETQPAQLSTYPNPATDFINIKIEGDFYYEIYNPKGQTVLKGQNTNKIDISSLPKGNYSIKATTSKQILKSQIIVN
ncbi:MAG: T9SS type A sorting domain-containing protein, partial [Bacteroidia bacterium]